MTSAEDKAASVVDAHHHVWDLGRHRHAWLDKHSSLLNRTLTMTDLAAPARASAVTATVVVQCLSETAETRYLLKQAAAEPLIQGVVGYADLRSDRLREQLESLLAAPGGRWLRGIRYNLVHAHEDDFADGRLIRGLRMLAEHDLAFDLITVAPKLGWAARLADAAPDTRIVLDHAGNPPIAQRTTDPWAADLSALARRPNMWCKLSGLGTVADHHAWTIADLRPYSDTVLSAFSPARVAIGSDWPVSLLAGGYARMMDTYRQLTDTLSASERHAVRGGSAERLYRLATFDIIDSPYPSPLPTTKDAQ